MNTATSRTSRTRTWIARLSLVTAAAAAVIPMASAGLRSITLLGLGVAGLALTVAALWWALTHRGVARACAAVLVIAVPVAVLVRYAIVGMLGPVVMSGVLMMLAVLTGRVALGMGSEPASSREFPALPLRRPFLIMNPRSGGGKVSAFDLVAKARERGAQVALLDPAHHQDVTELARKAVAEGADLLGVAGGDGTQALVAAVAAEHGVPFMVISAGTRNHFAMDLGLDRNDPSTCLAALDEGVEIRVDLGRINDRVFVNNASFGAYAAIVQSPAYRDDKTHTTLEMLPELLTGQRGPRLTVRTDTVTVEDPQAVLVSNNPYHVGDPAGLGRRARLDSGVLGVLSVKVDNAVQAVGLIRRGRSGGLTSLTAREAVIDADVPEIPVGVDGEALMVATPVHCRIQPGVLRVRVPAGSRRGTARARPRLDWRRLWHLAVSPRQHQSP
ncbi:diacylglycerol kinase family protein [Nonomuraea sp. NPDC003804]|uniref:diacylglycerol/lipid kinase family protein n=1 Tax=Nonomuraea sp. NPDC003804 TaxID=3154547 RepID=UPI0033A0F1C3